MVCIGCEQEYDESKFQKNPHMVSGRLNYCNACVNTKTRIRYAKNIDKVREAKRLYRNSPQRVVVNRERIRAWDRNNPEKRKAYGVLKYAVKIGAIEKPEACERCGKKARLHAHHPDYSKPLAVDWLCQWCHVQEHKNV